MNAQGKVEVINTLLQSLGILSVFFAGFVLENLFFLSLFLFVVGVFALQIRAVEEEEEE
jgi:hypothetical protein